MAVAGITTIGTASARQFFRGDGELVRFASLYDEFAAVRFSNDARNRAAEMAMSKTFGENLVEALRRLSEL
jgi:hypothetical protein